MNHRIGDGWPKNRGNVQEAVQSHQRWFVQSPTSPAVGDPPSPIRQTSFLQPRFMPSPSRRGPESVQTPPRSVETPPRRCPSKTHNNNIQFSLNYRRPPNDTDEEYEELVPLFERSEARRARGFKSNSSQQPKLRSDQVRVESGLIKLLKLVIKDLKDESTYLFSLGMTSMTPYKLEDVRRTALFSRLIIISIQMLACFTLPRHENDGFRTSAGDNVNGTVFDLMTNATLGGLTNWDGQYFLHVATRGYTHENTMAFFPLFPITIGFLAKLVHLVLSPVLTLHSVTLLVGVGVNVWCFQNAAVVLGQLVQTQAGTNIQLAERFLPTVIYLFCYNPASIFFIAFYTESLFAWLTFSCILGLYERNFERAVISASLSVVCRSNGLLNFGLIGLVALSDVARGIGKGPRPVTAISGHDPTRPLEPYTEALTKLVRIGLMCLLGLLPFGLFQLYCAKEFCVPDGTCPMPPFCYYNGLPYTYIQGANWNVGFLQYFELKQIPNFLLAAPVLFTLGVEAQRHARRHGLKLVALRDAPYEDTLDLALSLHGAFLTIFCLFFVHVQVSTRMIMSACPYIYAYIAKNMSDERSLFLSRLINSTPYASFINIWFGMYFLVGTVGFSLGYPWT